MEWEEEMYWTHFQTIHFSQFFLPGFDQRLPIPQKFSTNCKRKLPLVVTLKSPSGVTYNVGLQAETSTTMAFRTGWEEFAKDHSLEHHDLLVFKFNGVSHFDVIIFDGNSFCEKAASYFVRKSCHHPGGASERNGKRKVADCSATSGAPERYVTSDIFATPMQQPVISSIGNEQEDDICFDFDTTPDHQPGVSQTERRRGSSINSTKRRARADSRKENALLSLAEAATSQDGFLVVMKHSHVVPRFFMTIPKPWAVKHLSDETQEVVLRMDQTTWSTSFNYCRTRKHGGLAGGWKKFVIENSLNESDICVFEPANSGIKPLLLDVKIFRAAGAEPAAMPSPLQYIEEQTQNPGEAITVED